MNPYIYEEECYKRLKRDYIKYGKLYIAVDFDDTIYDYYQEGHTYGEIFHLLKRWEPYSEVIIFTCSGEERYDFIKEYLAEKGVKYSAINIDLVGFFSSHKVYANVYLDDRGGLPTTYRILNRLIDEIEAGKIAREGE